MANASTTIQEISIRFLDKSTNCYVYYSSTEPENPFWGGNDCRFKSFSVDTTALDIIPEVIHYLDWEQKCPTCHQDKLPAGTCTNRFHLDPLKAVLDLFNEDVT